MVILGRMFSWRDALVNIKPDTFIRWHRKGFRLLWRWKSRPVGRPRIPKDLRRLIAEMAAENPTWGEERIANELKLKLTVQVSPRAVGKYLRRDGPVRTPDPKQRWLTFVRNHSKVIVACDFFVVITAAFRTLYVLVVMEIGSRQILHQNVTAHPTAEWTLQQLREAFAGRSSVPIRYPRSRQDLLRGCRQGPYQSGCTGSADAGASPEIELVVRATRRQPSPGVSRLPDSIQRTAFANDCSGLDDALQPREAAFGVRPRSDGAHVGPGPGQRA